MRVDLVLVEWRDAHSESDWKRVREALDAHKPLLCYHVGWVLKRDSTGISLTPAVTADDDVSDIMFIPAGMIKKVTVLKKARKLSEATRQVRK